jgi:hypothetical protein
MNKKEIFDLLDQIFRQAERQFGSVVKTRWFYDGDGCPGCGSAVTGLKFKKQNAISLNAFIYREHGVLIGYLLCGKCARHIMKESEKDPLTPTALHTDIEKNLKLSFLKHQGH